MARARPSTANEAPVETPEAFLSLTPEQIASQTDSGSFSRGKTYFRGGRIFAPLRRGPVIQARCHGSSGGPYRVEATLATAGGKRKKNPVDYFCDCPRGGFCKHVVALLLTWIDAPERFEVRPPIAEVLAGKSREELIALIERMVREEPEFEPLLELPIPVAGILSVEPIDEAALRRQIEAAFAAQQTGPSGRGRRSGWYEYDDWESAARIAGNLEQLIDLGDEYIAGGNWRNAVATFAVVAEMTIPHLSRFADPNGDLFSIVGGCDRGLAECLDAQAEAEAEDRLTPAERIRLIDALLVNWDVDIAHDGPGVAEDGEDAIARGATPEERVHVANWLRSAIGRFAASEHDQSWAKRAALGFLALLGPGGGLSDEELLAEYRAAELWVEAALTLLRLGRIDEGIGLAARHLATTDLIAFANEMLEIDAPRRGPQAIDLIDGRLWEQEGKNPREDQVLLAWLAREHAAHGQPAKAFDMARRRFDIAPSKEAYDALKAAALAPGQPDGLWDRARPTLHKALRKQEGVRALIEIHLEEGDVAAAVKALEASQKKQKSAAYGYGGLWWYGGESLDARVAEAAEASDPEAAVRIYRRLAEREIDARQRTHYQQAAAYLARVKLVMANAGRAEEWTADIAELRQSHKTLRALREELDALDLR